MINTILHHNIHEYTVTEISQSLKKTVEMQFGHVRIRGEISGFKKAPSGHAYLNLKDDQSILASVCWRGTMEHLGFQLEDGLEVIATGKLTIYPGQSKYQLVIDRLEASGVGALMALLEKRKKQLAAEGLFDPERKKKIPFFPRLIGVITSPTGAVIKDILHRIEERFPTHVMIWPVLVQGEQAAGQITAAIEGFNKMAQKPDLLIVARGGGSLEDLWPFNEEIVVRAAAASKIPLISAVGHETDITLIDYAADKRAPTPTAAAEMATPVRDELMMRTREMELRLYGILTRMITQQQEKIRHLWRVIPNISAWFDDKTQKLDFIGLNLHRVLPSYIDKYSQRIQLLKARIQKPEYLIDLLEVRMLNQLKEMGQRYQRLVELKEAKLHLACKLLEGMHYKKVLARGFALIKQKDKLVTSVQELEAGEEVSVELQDGQKKMVVS